VKNNPKINYYFDFETENKIDIIAINGVNDFIENSCDGYQNVLQIISNLKVSFSFPNDFSNDSSDEYFHQMISNFCDYSSDSN
jgi:hypothetical protein